MPYLLPCHAEFISASLQLINGFQGLSTNLLIRKKLSNGVEVVTISESKKESLIQATELKGLLNPASVQSLLRRCWRRGIVGGRRRRRHPFRRSRGRLRN